MENNALLENIGMLHTTPLGAERIKRNLLLDADEDAVRWCREVIQFENAVITREGKNWYICAFGARITINACSYTIITAHRLRP